MRSPSKGRTPPHKTSDEEPTEPARLAKVALVGRVNVGKSSLFNRLTGHKRALVSMEPGTTRDRQEGLVEWQDSQFTLIDTGGVEKIEHSAASKKITVELDQQIGQQARRAAEQADLVILVVSAADGILPQDKAWADLLRGQKPTMLVVNKVDNRTHENVLPEFYKLGLGEPVPVSAASGRLSGDLLDTIVAKLKTIPLSKKAESMWPAADLTVALLGQPNSGKSSLLNAILGEERVIVSPIPRTTREPIDTHIEYGGRKILLIDTAGIRRRAQVTRGVEALGVSASLKTVERAEIILLLIDVMRGPTLQDQRLAEAIRAAGKGIVIVANKWDLVADKTPQTLKKHEVVLRRELPGLEFAPLIFVSAQKHQRVDRALDLAIHIKGTRRLEIDEAILHDFLKFVTRQHLPSKGGGVKHPKIMSLKQTGTEPPEFTIVTRGELHPSYIKFLENQLREKFDLVGTPIKIILRTLRKKILR
jgi:GTPase